MDWVLLLSFWPVFHVWCSVVSENQSGRRSRRFKRVVYGLELSSHDLLNTQYMVALKHIHGCESAAEAKRLPACDEYSPKCGGALIAPDFVLTACHCIIYEHYHVEGVELPKFDPTFDSWTTSTSTTDNPNGTVKPIYVSLQPLHPIYNLLSLWMGSVDFDHMPQRQFAKAFFPHSLCTVREIIVIARSTWEQEHLWNLKPPEFDIGLVRAWSPFLINKDVKLVPMKLGDDLLTFHRHVLKTMSVCLFTGFGATEDSDHSRFLRYSYRHTQCTTNCMEQPELALKCELCSTSIARPDKRIRITQTGHGDSGSPLVCDDDGKYVLLGVLSAAEEPIDAKRVNTSNAIFSSVVCIREFLTNEQLKFLREQDDKNVIGVKLDTVHMGAFEDK